MSRSFKRTFGFVDSNRNRWKDKRLANKRVRRASVVSHGRWYVRLYNQYDLRDWSFLCYSEQDLRRRYEPTTKWYYKAKRK